MNCRQGLAVVCLSTGLSWAADSVAVRGEVQGGPGAYDGLTVHLISPERGNEVQRSFIGRSGQFEFQSIPSGNYMLEVRNLYGDPVKKQFISVAGMAFQTTITLGDNRNHQKAPVGAAAISLARLRHDPDGHAAQEFQMGAQFLEQHNWNGAKKHFEKALKADPDYAEAHLELGTLAHRRGELGEARAEFTRATELDPKYRLAWQNLGAVNFAMNDHAEAARVARLGLGALGDDAKLHFLLGGALVAQNRADDEVVMHLERASAGFPNAHLVLAEVLLKRGEVARALGHLEASLKAEQPAVRERAEYLRSLIVAAR